MPNAAPDEKAGLFFEHPPGYRLRRARNWLSLGFMYAAYYMCRYNLSVVSTYFKKELGFSNTAYGAISAGRDGFYGLGQFINGLFSDRLGGKTAMLIGAGGTILANVAFGLTAWSNVAGMFWFLFILRSFDGYMQSFGAPGMVKINAAWFRRQERGSFAGIFGATIQMGVTSVNLLWTLLSHGFSIPLLFMTAIVVPALDWRYMFIVPPAIVALMALLVMLNVKNHPEDAGFRIVHADESPDEDPHDRLPLRKVFVTIAGNPVVWIVALAYMCTGFVRRAIESWWVIYLDEIWHAGPSHWAFITLSYGLPLSAFLGSLGSGLISDNLAKGRRAPVAAGLYGLEALLVAIALLLSISGGIATVWLAITLLLVLNLTCNSTHSILGTAAAMDVGGRKMSGFSLGLINTLQYVGSVQATYGLGVLFDVFGKAERIVAAGAPAATQVASSAASTAPTLIKIAPTVWFASMLPFAVLGTLLMLYLTIRHRGTNERGT